MEIKTNDSATDSECSDFGQNTDESLDPNVTRRKNSFVWQYFRQIEESQSYECIICNGCVGRQTSNLARHLAFTHNIKNKTHNLKLIGKRGRPSKSFIWKYCTKEDEKHARCDLCNRLLYFGGGNTENIAKHLRRKHANLIETDSGSRENMNDYNEAAQAADNIDTSFSNGDAEIAKINAVIARERKERKGGSYVWNYCEKVSRHTIRCNLCQKVMSFHGTANVITHLQRKHNIVGKIVGDRATLDNTLESTMVDLKQDDEYQQQQDESISTRSYKRSPSTASVVWRYCTRIGRDVVRCGFCKKNLSYQGTSNLQRHLHRMHGVITQGRLPKGVDAENFNSQSIWQHCTFMEHEDKAKCNLCDAVYDAKDTDDISKHLCGTHGIMQKSSWTTRTLKRRRRTETETDTSSYDDADFNDDWGKNDYSNDAVVFDENDIKKDESLFNDIIEEDPEHTNYDEEPFDPSMMQEYPSVNPLSPHSSRAGSLTRDNPPQCSSKKMQELNEEKVRMETDYFREKAGFYRMQKYLTALQAKKVRVELDQLAQVPHENLIVGNGGYSDIPVSGDMITP